MLNKSNNFKKYQCGIFHYGINEMIKGCISLINIMGFDLFALAYTIINIIDNDIFKI